MVEPNLTTQSNKTDQSVWCASILTPVRSVCWRVVVFLQFDAVVQAHWQEMQSDGDRVDIQHIRRQVRQLTKASKLLAIWLLLLSTIYLLVSMFTFWTFTEATFSDPSFSPIYQQELSTYAMDIERMKLAHSLALELVCLFIFWLVRQNKVLTKRQYTTLLVVTVGLTLFYILPVVYIAKKTFDDHQANSRGMQMFFDWFEQFAITLNDGPVGFAISVFTHLQIYMGIFALQFVTVQTKSAIHRLENLREHAQSDYAALELNNVMMQNTILNDDPEF